jgi:tetratricopeptide (TPR) repeat protein
MFNLIPIILILASLSVIIVIIVRKFPVLANLDLEEVQAEREINFKEQIISNRLKRGYFKYQSRIVGIIKPIGFGISNFFQWFYNKLIDFRDNYNNKEDDSVAPEERVNILFSQTEEQIKNEEYDKAEKTLIEIIGLDSKNIKAFKELGQVYYTRKDFNEAKQTYLHALKLLENGTSQVTSALNGVQEDGNNEINSDIASIYFNITLINKAMEDFLEALKNINNALKIEPNNPRYLDTKLEISIINKDRVSALDAFEKLVEVNPENQKLDELKTMVDEL